jgi:putative FmdB family regulatory protein
MPLYDYECCGHRWDAFHTIADRLKEPCPRCGHFAHQIIGIPYTTKDFKPYFDQSLGVVVKNRREKAMLLKEKGLLEVSKSEFQKHVFQPGMDGKFTGDPAAGAPTAQEVEAKLAEIRQRSDSDEFRAKYDPTHPSYKPVPGPEATG